MILKEGVRVRGIRPEIVVAMMVANSVYEKHGYECVVTSGVEGSHAWTSLHYAGAAIDMRIRDIPKTTVVKIAKSIKSSLGPDFDTILEDTHIHIEYQPKGE